MSIKSAKFSLLAIVVSAAVSLLLLELVIRLMIPAFAPSDRQIRYVPATESEPRLGLKNSQHRQVHTSGEFNIIFRFNKYGFRDSKDLVNSTVEDIFVVGDSFSIGYGVEESARYSNRLETLIDRAVYNIAIPTDFDGYEKLVRYAQLHGAAIKNLIIGICMENDLKDYSQLPGQTAAMSRQKASARLKVFLERHSALYLAFVSLIYTKTWLSSLAERLGLIETYERIDWYSRRIIDSSARRLAAIAKPFSTTVMIIPSRGLWVGPSTSVVDRVHREFVAILRGSGLNVLDLRPHFEESGNPMQYHYVRDGHWNLAGHAKAAEVMAVHLTSRGDESNCERRQLPLG